MITLGGDAELEVVDSLNPFSEGVVFSVRPRKKSWKKLYCLWYIDNVTEIVLAGFALDAFDDYRYSIYKLRENSK